MSSNLKSMFDDLNIPQVEQTKFFSIHGITNYKTLKAKQYQLDRRQLSGINPAAQRIVAAALAYLDSMRCEDPIANFTRKGWMTFAVDLGESTFALPSSHGGGGEGGEGGDKAKITLDSEKLDKFQVPEETKNSGGDAMDVDEDEGEDFGPSSKDIGHVHIPGRLKRSTADEDDEDQSEDEGLGGFEQGNQGKFDLMQQGFNPVEANPFNIPADSDSSNKEDPELKFVDWNGKRFWKGKCYRYEDSNGTILVGISAFRSKSTASCVRVEHISETFLGHDDHGEFESAVLKHYSNSFVQIKGARSLKVSELGSAVSEPSDLPKLIYEPQTARCRQMLAYIRDNDGNNILRAPRNEINLIEGFAGAGGKFR
jgi:hypothetical protein